MRIPYVSDPPPAATPEEQAIVDRVRARRNPRPLQPLDLALLHSPPVADGWNSFLGAIRTKTDSVPASLRELAICRVAVCNRAWYEWMHHAPLAIQAGVPESFMEDYVKGCEDLASITPEQKATAATEAGVGDKEWAVLRFTDEMTRRVQVPDEVFAEMKKLFGEKEIVEITATVSLLLIELLWLVCADKDKRPALLTDDDILGQVAAYNCVSRFLVALDGE